MAAGAVAALGALAACAPPPPVEPFPDTLPTPDTQPTPDTVPTPDTLPVPDTIPSPVWDPSDRLANDWGLGLVLPDLVDVDYDPAGDHPDRIADVYLPRSGDPRGVILYLHGGGFTGGHRDLLGEHAGPLLRQLDRGFAIVNLEYRKDPFPAAVHDTDVALRFVRSDAGRALGLDPSTVIVAGHSAGGTIAAVHALGANSVSPGLLGELDAVDGWISISGALDLDGDAAEVGGARDSWGAGDAGEASPAALLDPADPRGLVIHGDLDPIVPVLHATAFRELALDMGHSGLTTEIVQLAPDDCRGHLPMCGASIRGIDEFVDGVVAGRSA